jgi:cardiolipin synthase
VGSSNLDPLSLLLAREANVVVEDAAFARSCARLVRAMQHGAGRWTQHATRAALARARARPRGLRLMRLALWVTGNRY